MKTNAFSCNLIENTVISITYDKLPAARKYNLTPASLTRLLGILNVAVDNGQFKIFGTSTGFVAHREDLK